MKQVTQLDLAFWSFLTCANVTGNWWFFACTVFFLVVMLVVNYVEYKYGNDGVLKNKGV